MCNCVREKRRLIREIDQLAKQGERWTLIKNRSNRLEMIPERSLEGLTNIQLIYKLKN